jgi:hypothetical protein
MEYYQYFGYKCPQNIIYADPRLGNRYQKCTQLMNDCLKENSSDFQWIENFKKEYILFSDSQKYKDKLAEIGERIQLKIMNDLEVEEIANINKLTEAQKEQEESLKTNKSQKENKRNRGLTLQEYINIKLKTYNKNKNKRFPTVGAIADRHNAILSRKNSCEKATSSNVKSNSWNSFFGI